MSVSYGVAVVETHRAGWRAGGMSVSAPIDDARSCWSALPTALKVRLEQVEAAQRQVRVAAGAPKKRVI